jgi:hypothetical protein
MSLTADQRHALEAFRDTLARYNLLSTHLTCVVCTLPIPTVTVPVTKHGFIFHPECVKENERCQ